jgi:F-type H+-transporting ATPase subunit alpha
LLERACKLADKYVIVPKATPADATVEGVNKHAYVGPLGLKAANLAIKTLPGGTEQLKVHRLPLSGGSQTALPICETQEGEVSAYIPTNLISITDGQIYLEPSLFFAGVRPAINVGISVSRVGYKAAIPAMKDVAKSLRLDLAAYRELESFAQLGMELDPASQRQLDRGARMIRLLIQPQYQPKSAIDQVIAIFAGVNGFLDDLPLEDIADFEAGLLEHVKSGHRYLYDELATEQRFNKEREKALKTIVAEFKESFKQNRRGRKAAGKV